MPKIKLPKSSPALDMTPMVDLAFLLVTFFMLTAQFKPEEEPVDTPSSVSQMEVPKEDIMFITIDTAGRVMWDFKEGKTKQLGVRAEILESMSKKYNIAFNEAQKEKFIKLSGIAVPIQNLPEFLDQENGDARKKYNARFQGVPYDSLNNQFKEWLVATRVTYYTVASAQPTVVLKADGDVNYDIVNQIIKIFQSDEVGISRFKMVTDMEKSGL
jgi:biopolymer transport protein ExbD